MFLLTMPTLEFVYPQVENFEKENIIRNICKIFGRLANPVKMRNVKCFPKGPAFSWQITLKSYNLKEKTFSDYLKL